MLLDHVRSLTDKLLVLETEKAALIVANATMSRDVAEIKRALTSRTLRVCRWFCQTFRNLVLVFRLEACEW
jgi:hypothetical protein